MLKTFFAPRYKIILALLIPVLLLAVFGRTMGASLPIIGIPVFIISILVWYLPALVFAGSGLFIIHELGASTTGWVGDVVMFLFYFAVATLISLPFGGKWRKKRKARKQKNTQQNSDQA